MDTFEKMVKDGDEGIRLNPKDAKAYYTRAMGYGCLGNSQQSIEDFTVSITLSPTWNAYHARGYEYWKVGARQKAIDDFRKGLEYDKDHEGLKTSLQQALAGTLMC